MNEFVDVCVMLFEPVLVCVMLFEPVLACVGDTPRESVCVSDTVGDADIDALDVELAVFEEVAV
jgi:hypothetical protein